MGIKFNWGWGILITMMAFMGFIMTMVYKISSENAFNHELVFENYYQRDLVYQDEIDAEKRGFAFDSQIKFLPTSEGLGVLIAQELTPRMDSIYISLRHGATAALDFEAKIKHPVDSMLLEHKNWQPGPWIIDMAWQMEGQTLLIKKRLRF